MKILKLATAALLFISSVGISHAAIINFDNTEASVSNLENITNQWSSFGLGIDNAYYYQDSRDTFDGEGLSQDDGGPGRIDFLNGSVDNVSVDWWTINGTLEISSYDASDSLVSFFDAPDIANTLGSVNLGSNVAYILWGVSNGFDQISTLRYDEAVVPEPSIIALFGLGLIGLGFARRKKSV